MTRRRALPDINAVVNEERDYWLNATAHKWGPRKHTLRKHYECTRELARFSRHADPAKVAELAAALLVVVAELKRIGAALSEA